MSTPFGGRPYEVVLSNVLAVFIVIQIAIDKYSAAAGSSVPSAFCFKLLLPFLSLTMFLLRDSNNSSTLCDIGAHQKIVRLPLAEIFNTRQST